MAQLRLRVDFDTGYRLGPGQIQLLEEIGRTGSISAAGRAMGMSYRRAWLLVDSLNDGFRHSLVATTMGGKRGGGAELTPMGRVVVREYREMEQRAQSLLRGPLAKLRMEANRHPRRPIQAPRRGKL